MNFDPQAYMTQSPQVTVPIALVEADLPHHVDNNPRPLIIVPVVLLTGSESSSSAVELKVLLDTGANIISSHPASWLVQVSRL
jgi:hypothetical protein